MSDLLLTIDESGAKGYSDQTERQPGEVGVMVGFVIPVEETPRVKSELKLVQEGFFASGKLHITDLNKEEQEQLRAGIFDYFQQTKIPWLFEAVYVQGFFENAESIKKRSETIRKERRSHIKVAHHPYKESLHSELFLGVFGKAVAFGTEVLKENKFQLQVLTDPVDKKILKMFEEEARKLLNVGLFIEPVKKPTLRIQVIRFSELS